MPVLAAHWNLLWKKRNVEKILFLNILDLAQKIRSLKCVFFMIFVCKKNHHSEKSEMSFQNLKEQKKLNKNQNITSSYEKGLFHSGFSVLVSLTTRTQCSGQWSQFWPMTPSRQAHWPVMGSQVPPTANSVLQPQLSQPIIKNQIITKAGHPLMTSCTFW